jgi:hypothetical protein
VRAIKIFFTHAVTGKTIGWDKTTHEFPEQVHNASFKPDPGTLAGSSIKSTMFEA